jgi:Rrf2 family protein
MACLQGVVNGGKPMSVVEIAKVLNVSKDHLGKVLQRLSRAKLVLSRRGPRGGFTIAEESKDITLLEILEVIDGPLTNTACLLGNSPCGGNCYCIFRGLIKSLHDQVQQYLSSTSLNDIVGSWPFVQQFTLHERERRPVLHERERQLAAAP